MQNNKQRLFEMMEKINPEFQFNEIESGDSAPIVKSDLWRNMIEKIKKTYNIDDIRIVGYNTDKPYVEIFKSGFTPSIIWQIQPSYLAQFRQPAQFRIAIGNILMKLKKYGNAPRRDNKFHDWNYTTPKFIITVGISGSGKSRWINSLKGQGYKVISPDEIRRELTGSISDQSKNRDVFIIAYERVISELNAHNSVIFDATNVTSKTRKQMLDYMKENVTRDFDAFAKIFDADPEISKERIARDIEAGVDRSNVPPEAIDRQHGNFLADLDKIEADGYNII